LNQCHLNLTGCGAESRWALTLSLIKIDIGVGVDETKDDIGDIGDEWSIGRDGLTQQWLKVGSMHLAALMNELDHLTEFLPLVTATGHGIHIYFREILCCMVTLVLESEVNIQHTRISE